MPQAPTPSPRRTFVRAALVTAVVFAAGMAVASQTGLLGASSAPASNVGTAVAIDTVVATPATIIQYRDITIDAPVAKPAAGAPAAAADPAADQGATADPAVTADATEVVYVDEVAPAGESGEGEHDGDDEGEHEGARSERHESHEDEGGELDD